MSSGASFQARVAAYVITSTLCRFDSPISFGSHVKVLSFETGEAVDDLNLELANGEFVYLQAKAALSYSVNTGSEMLSVLDQFVRQRLSDSSPSKYVLVTTGRATKKITFDFRAALDAFRSAPRRAFERDQPKAIQEIILEVRAALQELILGHGGGPAATDPDDILKAIYVCVLDVEHGSSLEEASILLLQANGFVPPRAVWGKMVADALTHAKQRHTIGEKELFDSYERFRAEAGGVGDAETEAELLRVEFGDMQFPTGKEVVLCELAQETMGVGPGAALFEMYRFDEACNERCKFSEEAVELLNGLNLKLIRRSATMTGMARLLEANPGLIGDLELTIVPMNTDEDFEDTPCADAHRQRLKAAALANPTPLMCIHCGRPVSADNAAVVETGVMMDPQVGLVHDSCLLPPDRIVGLAKSGFFEQFPELVHFDANAWFRAAHEGQMAFGGAQVLGAATSPILAWGGREPTGPRGDYVVEIALQNGEREIVTQRNGVHRFMKDEAEQFAILLNQQFEEARAKGDPLCYSDQSKAFGPRSLVLQMVGGKEVIRRVDAARVRKFRSEFAARYSRPGQWYAPLMYLIRSDTGQPVGLHGAVFLITDPLTLGNHLANWQETGLLLDSYEVRLLLTDTEFDEFMRWAEDHELAVVSDPMFDSTTGEMMSGVPILSMEAIEAGALSEFGG